jgi:UDP-N-acetylglucosamine--N-acetylmuramyl-(pentapeptide) pyrophosphoryl-undecaprenol N-acetylglucosamine transferase
MTTLLVASEGGHLVELQLLSQRLNIGDTAWLTFDVAESNSLLVGQKVYFAPFAGSRDFIGTTRAALWARKFFHDHYFETVVSSGASIALAVLPFAAHAGADCYYFETSTRTSGPSLTGRLLEPFRAITLFTPHKRWENQRWRYYTSIFDGFQLEPKVQPAVPQRVVVTLGLHKGFSFRRAVEHLVKIIPQETEVLWQTGGTDVSGLGVDAHVSLPATDLFQAMTESDAVIMHAGVGSIVSALKAGKRPVVLPRRKQFKEHVDDHQTLLADDLEDRALVVRAEADELQWSDVVEASSWRVYQTPPGLLSLPGRPTEWTGPHSSGKRTRTRPRADTEPQEAARLFFIGKAFVRKD